MNIQVYLATDHMLAQVRYICEHAHYLKRWPDPRSLPFAYFLELDGQTHANDGRLLGIVVLKKPQHHQMRGLFGYAGLPTEWQCLDLARVWVHPTLQHKANSGHALCVFSQMVSKALKRVGWDWVNEVHPPRYPDRPYHIEVVISYCDLEHHDGVAYRASGFRWHGYSQDRSKEVYVRLLKAPLKRWQPKKPVQMPLPLFPDMPLVHGG